MPCKVNGSAIWYIYRGIIHVVAICYIEHYTISYAVLLQNIFCKIYEAGAARKRERSVKRIKQCTNGDEKRICNVSVCLSLVPTYWSVLRNKI